jgi:hypothetical protein
MSNYNLIGLCEDRKRIGINMKKKGNGLIEYVL